MSEYIEKATSGSVENQFTSKEKIKGQPETSEDGVVTSSSTTRTGGVKAGSVGETHNGAIGSKAADRTVAAKETASSGKKEQNKTSTVAIHSTKNVTWPGVGKVDRGYNIVSESEASKWLTRSHVRVATPEEIASEYGV
jgi:hypothetical protein